MYILGMQTAVKLPELNLEPVPVDVALVPVKMSMLSLELE